MPLPGEPDVYVLALDPPAVATARTELAINDPASGIQVGGTSSGSGVDWGQAEINAIAAQEGQWGSTVAGYTVPNRTVTIPLGLGMGGPGTPDANTALSKLAQKVGLLQREGGWLLRQREGGDALYLDVVDAQLTVPDVWGETGGVEPGVTLTLITRPDWYGDEIALDSIACSGYCDAVLTSGGVTAVIEGDYPARCRMQVLGNASGSQYSAFWGFRSRYYGAGAHNDLFYPATSLFAGVGTSSVALSGCYSATQIQSPALSASWPASNVNVVSFEPSTSIPEHVGTYQVWARMQGSTSGIEVALTWQSADITPPVPGTPNTTTNTSAVVPSSGFGIVNLGVVTLPSLPPGLVYPPSWMGAINAKSPSGSGNVVFDSLWLQPLAENAGTAEVSTSGSPALILSTTFPTEFRTEGIYSQALGSVGVGYWLVPFTGALPRLPVSGLEGRAAQFLFKPSRTAFGSVDPDIDQFTVTPYYRPCWMFRP